MLGYALKGNPKSALRPRSTVAEQTGSCNNAVTAGTYLEHTAAERPAVEVLWHGAVACSAGVLPHGSRPLWGNVNRRSTLQATDPRHRRGRHSQIEPRPDARSFHAGSIAEIALKTAACPSIAPPNFAFPPPSYGRRKQPFEGIGAVPAEDTPEHSVAPDGFRRGPRGAAAHDLAPYPAKPSVVSTK